MGAILKNFLMVKQRAQIDKHKKRSAFLAEPSKFHLPRAKHIKFYFILQQLSNSITASTPPAQQNMSTGCTATARKPALHK